MSEQDGQAHAVEQVNKEETLNTARAAVGRAVEVAERAGISPATVVEPFCRAGGADNAATTTAGLSWLGVPVSINDASDALFEMPPANEDPAQQPTFIVTAATAELIKQDFALYSEGLANMLKDWQEEKTRRVGEGKATAARGAAEQLRVDGQDEGTR